jgi:6-phosphogluconate dehydrogenase
MNTSINAVSDIGSDVGLVGLAVMGQNLALNIADHGYQISVYNRNSQRTTDFIANCAINEPASDKVSGFSDVQTFMQSIN